MGEGVVVGVGARRARERIVGECRIEIAALRLGECQRVVEGRERRLVIELHLLLAECHQHRQLEALVLGRACLGEQWLGERDALAIVPRARERLDLAELRGLVGRHRVRDQRRGVGARDRIEHGPRGIGCVPDELGIGVHERVDEPGELAHAIRQARLARRAHAFGLVVIAAHRAGLVGERVGVAIEHTGRVIERARCDGRAGRQEFALDRGAHRLAEQAPHVIALVAARGRALVFGYRVMRRERTAADGDRRDHGGDRVARGPRRGGALERGE